jgi:hypothetical protein
MLERKQLIVMFHENRFSSDKRWSMKCYLKRAHSALTRGPRSFATTQKLIANQQRAIANFVRFCFIKLGESAIIAGAGNAGNANKGAG